MNEIGKMRHRLMIERRETVPDGAGGTVVTWMSGETVWAAIEPVAGVEVLRQDRLSGTLTHRVTVRYRSDIAPEMRFRSGDRIFEISVVRDIDERHRWLDCICEEKYL